MVFVAGDSIVGSGTAVQLCTCKRGNNTTEDCQFGEDDIERKTGYSIRIHTNFMCDENREIEQKYLMLILQNYVKIK